MRRARDQPRRRVERDEELVGGDGRGAGEAVEQRRLARIGVADEGHHGHPTGLAPVAEEPAVHTHTLELLGDLPDAVADHPPVGLDLRLAGSPRADATAQPLEVFPLPDQAREHVRELGELYLQLPLHRARPLGEDVEDERGPVDDAQAERATEVPLLDGRQRIVGDHEVGVLAPGQRLDLLHLALAEVERGARRLPLLGEPAHHLRARRLGQTAQLVERLVHLDAPLLGQAERGEECLLLLSHSINPSCMTTLRILSAAPSMPPA
jgi:hypothetical protein